MVDLYSANNKKKEVAQQKVEEHIPYHHSNNPLTAFSYQPNNVKFETQEDRENIVLLLRQHPIVNLSWIFVTVILVFAPSLLTVFPIIDFLPQNFQLVAVLFWYLIVCAYVLESALSWFFNVYMATNERVIDVDFENLLYREVSEADLNKIQDVEYQIGGVMRTIFNYGDVYIQTAGSVPNFEFKAVPNPAEVVRIIQELKNNKENEERTN